MLPVHTGMPWFDVVVYIVSGGGFLGVCWYGPRFVLDQWRLWRGVFRRP